MKNIQQDTVKQNLIDSCMYNNHIACIMHASTCMAYSSKMNLIHADYMHACMHFNLYFILTCIQISILRLIASVPNIKDIRLFNI